MKLVLAGVAAVAMLTGVAPPTPATAMPIQNLAASEANTAASNYTEVRYRRVYRHRRVFVGRRYVTPYPYYAYGYPYRYYAPGPSVRIGPFGFGFW